MINDTAIKTANPAPILMTITFIGLLSLAGLSEVREHLRASDAAHDEYMVAKARCDYITKYLGYREIHSPYCQAVDKYRYTAGRV